MDTTSISSFHWVDYLIFILVLVISTAIGIFFAWKDRRKQNADDFLLGGRKMGIFPVSLSLMATLLSAVMVLGVPAEVYYNGSIYWLILFSNILVYPVAAHMFLPVYHNLGITSAYEVSGFQNITPKIYRLLDSLVVECWLRVREVRVQSPVKDRVIPKTL